MAKNLPRCQELYDICDKNPDVAVCAAADKVCWDGVISLYDGESDAGGRNRFDSKWNRDVVFGPKAQG